MNLQKLQKDEAGFTLIELLVVILIIGILSAIAIPMFLNQRKAAVDASLMADTKSVVLAQESALIKTPNKGGTISKKALRATASRLSPDTTVGTWFVDGKGFCVVSLNTASSSIGNTSDQRSYLWYDSALGGFVKAPNATTPPTGGACANPRPPIAEQAWWYAGDNAWTSNVD